MTDGFLEMLEDLRVQVEEAVKEGRLDNSNLDVKPPDPEENLAQWVYNFDKIITSAVEYINNGERINLDVAVELVSYYDMLNHMLSDQHRESVERFMFLSTEIAGIEPGSFSTEEEHYEAAEQYSIIYEEASEEGDQYWRDNDGA